MKIKNLKSLKNRSGIYGIKCIETNRLYIGCSINIQARLRTHMGNLNNNKHINEELQEDWTDNGKEGFVFFVFEFVDRGEEKLREILNEKEQYYIKRHNTCLGNNGYNRTFGGESNNPNGQMRLKIIEALNKSVGKPIFQIDFNGQVVKEWSSARKCARELGIKQNNINNCLRGRMKTYLNYIWIYKEELKDFRLKDRISPRMQIRRIGQYSLDGELIKIWIKSSDVLRFGFSDRGVIGCCKYPHKHKTHKGFIWKYLEEAHLEPNMISYEKLSVQRHYDI